MKPLVIVGTGLAGYTVAREWRRLAPESPLLVLTRDDASSYSKPMLSNALASGKTPAALPNATGARMAAQLQADILPHTTVSSIDPAPHTLLAEGKSYGYGKLVLALGADPIRLDMQGDGTADILSVNDLADYSRFRQQLQGRRKVLIMGAGLIGCEFANDLVSTGHEVDVVDPAPNPLGRLVPQAAGQAMEGALAKIGVRWHLGLVVTSVEHAGRGYRITLSDGSVLTSDLVLSAVGLRPRTELASRTGLSTNRGIVVDRTLAASATDIYALGDCAEVAGLVLPFVMPIMHAARALARTLTGETTTVTYPAMPVVVKTPSWPTVVAPPLPGREGDWDTLVTATGVRAVYRDGAGKLLGFALCGEAVAEKNALGKELSGWLG